MYTYNDDSSTWNFSYDNDPDISFNTREQVSTYSLVDSGTTEISKRGGLPYTEQPVYYVVHDQTGSKMQYVGASSDRYEYFTKKQIWRFGDYSIFYTFAMWDKKFRNNWKKNWLKKIEAEKASMYINWGRTEVTPTISVPDVDEAFDEIIMVDDILRVSKAINKRENQDMYAKTSTNQAAAVIAMPESETVAQRQYLLNRLYDARCEKGYEFRRVFNMNPVKGPKSLSALVEKIKSGDFELLGSDYSENHEFYSTDSLLDYIRWTKQPADTKGYEEAQKKMEAAEKTATDAIKILDPKDGLKALQDFEYQKFY